MALARYREVSIIWSTDNDLVKSRGLSISEMNPKKEACPTE